MRELEFLPPWYPQLRRRRRLLVVQGWGALLLAAGLGAWLLLVRGNLREAGDALASLDGALVRSRVDLRRMKGLEDQREGLRRQEQILSKLGLQVEPTRVLAAVCDAAPPGLALSGLSLETEERADAAAPAARLVAGPAGPAADRRLRVRLQGAVPTDADLADFMTRLAARPYFEQVAITFVKERSEDGRLLREFEVTFSLNLNAPAGG